MKISNECLDDLLEEGFNQSQIAQTCNISRQAISARIHYKSKRDNILRKRYSIMFLYRLGFTIAEMAELIGYSPITVARYLLYWGYTTTGRN